MRKKFLETTQPAPAPKIKEKYRKTLAVQIIEDKDRSILEVDVYKKGILQVRHFIDKDKEEYASLFVSDCNFRNQHYKAGDWSNMRLENVMTDGDFLYWHNDADKANSNKKALEMVGKYFSEKLQESNYWNPIIKLIERKENSYAWEQKERTLDNKKLKIEEIMSKVPLITTTEEFKQWIEEIFPERYLFRESRELKKGYRCHCSNCESTYYLKEKITHDTKTQCKKCKRDVIVKTRTNTVSKKKSVLVLQRYSEDTIVERLFRIEVSNFWYGKKAERHIIEQERQRLFLKKNTKTKIYYGVSHSQFAGELEQTWWTTKNGMIWDEKFILYPHTIKDAGLEKTLEDELLIGMKFGIEMNYNKLIAIHDYIPYMEYLFKSRFFEIAKEIISWGGHTPNYLNKNATNITDLLKLDKQRMYRLRDMNGNYYALKALQYEKEHGEKISQENLEFIHNNKVSISELSIDKTGLTVNRAINYIRRQMELNRKSFNATSRLYKDYLDMAAERGVELTDDIIRVNPKMLLFHDLYLEEKNKTADEKRAKETDKKFPNIRKNYRKNCERMEFYHKGYAILVPKNAGEIVREGRLQHHCVAASDNYFSQMNENKSHILFLRKIEDIEKPYYTLQVQDDEILQAYAAYNRKPNYAEVSKILSAWKKEMKKRNKKKIKQ